MIINSQVQALEALTSNLERATSIREKVRLADSIFATLAECEKLVEKFIVSAMVIGVENGTKRPLQVSEPFEQASSKHRDPSAKQFKGMNLADIGRELLKERGVLHGTEIEKLARSGGFKSDAKSFQSYLSVAFKRKGGFENIGKNRWKLNDDVNPANHVGDSMQPRGAAKNGGSQKMRLHEWLKHNGPTTRADIIANVGIPEGTASSYLSIEKDLFEKRDGKWHAL